MFNIFLLFIFFITFIFLLLSFSYFASWLFFSFYCFFNHFMKCIIYLLLKISLFYSSTCSVFILFIFNFYTVFFILKLVFYGPTHWSTQTNPLAPKGSQRLEGIIVVVQQRGVRTNRAAPWGTKGCFHVLFYANMMLYIGNPQPARPA